MHDAQALRSSETGSYVRQAETVSFLEKQLTAIGLNASEQNDFITYWAPRMMTYEVCKVHFLVGDAYDVVSTMTVEPQPDTQLRVFMVFEGMKEGNLTPLKAQEFPSFKREGFTLIEWGGTELRPRTFEN